MMYFYKIIKTGKKKIKNKNFESIEDSCGRQATTQTAVCRMATI